VSSPATAELPLNRWRHKGFDLDLGNENYDTKKAAFLGTRLLFPLLSG